MKKRLSLKIAILFMLALMLTSAPASAEVGMAGDLGIGGHVILGGTAGNGFGGFTFGLTPHISIFPIDNLAVFARLPFWEGNFAGGDVHVFPFMFGVRYYFNVLDNLRVYPGIAIGASVLHYPGVNFGFGFGNVGATTRGGFSLEFQGGVEYEVIENLAIDANFDIFIPRITSGTFVRIGVMAGVIWYLPVF